MHLLNKQSLIYLLIKLDDYINPLKKQKNSL